MTDWFKKLGKGAQAAVVVGAAIVVIAVLSALGGGNADKKTATTASTSKPVGATSAKQVKTFAAWYRRAAKEGGDSVPERLAPGAAASEEAMRGLIRILCATSASNTAERHAAAEGIKDDPEFFGDATFAASAIVMARQACGLD